MIEKCWNCGTPLSEIFGEEAKAYTFINADQAEITVIEVEPFDKKQLARCTCGAEIKPDDPYLS
ncbi:hypothetical protein [Methylobacterium oryzae]|uniref:hypothetical protein n=1 Tax=Methylobacterium oryzae TaxID=334852 RepID=UPI002F3405FD